MVPKVQAVQAAQTALMVQLARLGQVAQMVLKVQAVQAAQTALMAQLAPLAQAEKLEQLALHLLADFLLKIQRLLMSLLSSIQTLQQQ
jgi:hypothetical protein